MQVALGASIFDSSVIEAANVLPGRCDAVAMSFIGAVTPGVAWGISAGRISMGIDPKIEQPARTLLGHAIRHELDALASLVQAEGSETLRGVIPLCLFASAYIAIDVSGHWPTEADLKEIAKAAGGSVTRLDVTEQEIYAYLSRVALGSEQLDDVFSVEGLATVPLFTTANLLLTFCPQEKEWWEYLDQIWDAADVSEGISLSVLPALILRAHHAS